MEWVERIVERIAEHFGIPAPRVRVGCMGCPYYDAASGRCVLGYIACYDPVTKTITVSRPEYATEEVLLHEILHYVVDNPEVVAYSRVGFDHGLKPYLVPGPGQMGPAGGVSGGGCGAGCIAVAAAALALLGVALYRAYRG